MDTLEWLGASRLPDLPVNVHFIGGPADGHVETRKIDCLAIRIWRFSNDGEYVWDQDDLKHACIGITKTVRVHWSPTNVT